MGQKCPRGMETNTGSTMNLFREVSKGKEQKQLEKEVGSRDPFFYGCDEHI